MRSKQYDFPPTVPRYLCKGTKLNDLSFNYIISKETLMTGKIKMFDTVSWGLTYAQEGCHSVMARLA
jgi:hypothetical protein